MTRSACTVSLFPTLCFTAAILVAMAPGSALAQGAMPYDYFRTLSTTELSTFQLKLQWVGGRRQPMPAVILHADGESPELSAFFDAVHLGRDRRYVMDGPLHTAEVSFADIASIVSNIGTLPYVTGGLDTARPVVSVGLLVRLPTKHWFEAVLNSEQSSALFDKLRESLAGKAAAYRKVQDLACIYGTLESLRPQDVTASVSVRFSGVRKVAGSNQFVGTARIQNTTQNPLPGPISLVLDDLPYEVILSSADGRTCGTFPRGRPYVNFDAGSGLAPGQEAELKLEFKNDALVAFGACHCESDPSMECNTVGSGELCGPSDHCICKPTPKVLSGPGAR